VRVLERQFRQRRDRLTNSCCRRRYLDAVAQPRFDWDQIHPTEVAAIEVYRSGLEVPGQFANHANGCGAIVIWLKR
jgi:hypothetical protein